MQQHGDFGANLIFLVVSSHDAHDNITHAPIVDIHPSFPSAQPSSAIQELFARYLIPRAKKVFSGKPDKKIIDKSSDDPIAKSKEFNTGFADFAAYCKEKNIPFFIYLHADKEEVRVGKYNEQGDKIIAFCKENDIHLIKELDYPIQPEHFSDAIHLNTGAGQRFLAATLLPVVKGKLPVNTVL